jgi:hypothetical protein
MGRFTQYPKGVEVSDEELEAINISATNSMAVELHHRAQSATTMTHLFRRRPLA